jgi:hypothetical protein
MNNQLVFLCGARDFHAMDWYKSAKELLPDKEIYLLTDLIAGEGYKKLINEKDKVFKLIIIDRLLLKKQSQPGHLWRNFIKLLVFPLQIMLIKKFSKKYPEAIYHAHSMYYLFLAWAANVPYVGTPQGSDILIKPYRSKFYKYFTIKTLKSAKAITVDSVKMKEKIIELAGIQARIVQNGIDIEAIDRFFKNHSDNSNADKTILSIRGITPLYRIKETLMTRNLSIKYSKTPITFIYPFQESEYAKEIAPFLMPFDKNLGRVERMKMYELLAGTKLVISIPYSDSSPRSVYEAIFCGCAVAISYHPYYDILPQCMKSRIILVDLNDKYWFDKAVEESNRITKIAFSPSQEALNLFDQKRSFKIMEDLLFN